MEKVYLEFNGLPGSGKSTVCRETEKALANRLPVVSFIDVRSAAPKGLPFFLKQLLSALLHGRFRVIWLFLLFALRLPRGTPGRWICFYSSVRDYLLLLRCYQNMEAGILVNDQGIVQHFLSGFFDRTNESGIKQAGKIMRQAERDFADFRIAHMILTPELSLERMAGRESHGRRLELFSREKAGAVIRAQDQILNDLRREACNPGNSLEINALELPEENAEIIAAWIAGNKEEPEC